MNDTFDCMSQHQRRKCAEFLRKVSSAVNHRSFLKTYQSDINRFGQIDAIFDNLRYQLMYQTKQSMNWNASYNGRRLEANRNIPPFVAFTVLSDEINTLAQQIYPQSRLASCQFSVPKGKSFIAELCVLLKEANRFIQYLNDYERSNGQKTQLTFHVKGFLFALHCFIESVDTLCYETTHRQFESLLATVLTMPDDYILMGYLHDLLCHDKVVILNNTNVVAIHLAPKWLSTIQEFDDSTNQPDESMKFSRYSMAA